MWGTESLTVKKSTIATDLSTVSKEYLGLVDRVNNSLRILRADLISMRRQDVKLLKQLVNINDVIQAMYQKVKDTREVRSPDEPTDSGLDILELKRRAPLVRQQSVPCYCGGQRYERTFTGSSIDSSLDDLEELPEEDDFPYIATDDNDSLFSLQGACSTPKYMLRYRAISYEAPSSDNSNLDDSHFEDMLMKNIRLWKYSTDLGEVPG